MKQEERRRYLIEALQKENRSCRGLQIPQTALAQRQLLRSLMNVRPAAPISEEWIQVQNQYLSEVNAEKGLVSIGDLEELQPDLFLWQGDITRLQIGAIVNAANSGMTGCYQPCHSCIDNCIHTYAGIQLRRYCADLMEKQGQEEPIGQAKITPAFNLPCDFILHTVGPIVQGPLTRAHEMLLASCYRSCLAVAEQHRIAHLAFCCISTGVFRFPKKRAAEIAVETVKAYKAETGSRIKVVFNVFEDSDFAIYKELLS